MESSYYVEPTNYLNLEVGEKVVVTKVEKSDRELWNIQEGSIGKVVATRKYTCDIFNPSWSIQTPRTMGYDQIQRLK